MIYLKNLTLNNILYCINKLKKILDIYKNVIKTIIFFYYLIIIILFFIKRFEKKSEVYIR